MLTTNKNKKENFCFGVVVVVVVVVVVFVVVFVVVVSVFVVVFVVVGFRNVVVRGIQNDINFKK